MPRLHRFDFTHIAFAKDQHPADPMDVGILCGDFVATGPDDTALSYFDVLNRDGQALLKCLTGTISKEPIFTVGDMEFYEAIEPPRGPGRGPVHSYYFRVPHEEGGKKGYGWFFHSPSDFSKEEQQGYDEYCAKQGRPVWKKTPDLNVGTVRNPDLAVQPEEVTHYLLEGPVPQGESIGLAAFDAARAHARTFTEGYHMFLYDTGDPEAFRGAWDGYRAASAEEGVPSFSIAPARFRPDLNKWDREGTRFGMGGGRTMI